MAGISTSSAYRLYAGMLAIMLEITSPLRCSWCASAYSIASMPPHDCP